LFARENPPRGSTPLGNLFRALHHPRQSHVPSHHLPRNQKNPPSPHKTHRRRVVPHAIGRKRRPRGSGSNPREARRRGLGPTRSTSLRRRLHSARCCLPDPRGVIPPTVGSIGALPMLHVEVALWLPRPPGEGGGLWRRRGVGRGAGGRGMCPRNAGRGRRVAERLISLVGQV